MAKDHKKNSADEQLASPDRADFSRVYFDTCALDQWWPRMSRDFIDMLAVANNVDVPCFVPEPVLVELEEHWIARFYEKLTEFQRHIEGVVPEPALPGADLALSAYQASVKQLINRHTLRSVPFPRRSLEDSFRMTAKHLGPFEQDSGFRDGIIQLSIVEHLKDGAVGAILSNDKGFHAQCREFTRREGVTVELYSDVQVLRKALETLLNKAMSQKVAVDRERLRASLLEPSNWAAVKDYIQQNCTLRASSDIRAVKGVHEVKLQKVEAPFPPDRKEGAPIDFSFDVEVSLLISVLKWVAEKAQDPEPSKVELRIGERNPTSPEHGPFSAALNYFPTSGHMTQVESDEVQSFSLRIEARAKYAGGTYTDISFSDYEQVHDNPYYIAQGSSVAEDFATKFAYPRFGASLLVRGFRDP